MDVNQFHIFVLLFVHETISKLFSHKFFSIIIRLIQTSDFFKNNTYKGIDEMKY